ncbi:MAG TPA: hypothetical protein VFH39_04995 [Candidatus Saccharimonadales bacterium]|nr:hypothetical protein [Candidatus Saccharimonadales bacterium]
MKLRKLNTSGVTHTLVLLLVIVGAGILGSYFLVASHADTASILLRPVDWVPFQKIDTNSIGVVKDGSHGNVLLLKADTERGDGSAAVRYNSSKKLRDFLNNHATQPATVCVVARAEHSSKLSLDLVNMTSSSSATMQKTILLGNKYEKHCYDFKLATKSYLGYSQVDVTDQPNATNLSPLHNIYVDSLTISIR